MIQLQRDLSEFLVKYGGIWTVNLEPTPGAGICKTGPVEEELRSGLLNNELSELTRDEELHLEKEFEDYDKLYPRR